MSAPSRPGRRALLVGTFDGREGRLEESYRHALQAEGFQVFDFDLEARAKAHDRVVKRLPRGLPPLFRRALGVLWNDPRAQFHASRDLVASAAEIEPELVFVFNAVPVRAGALHQVRVLTGAKTVLVWPDPVLNLSDDVTHGLASFDLIASYSERACALFHQLGAPRAAFVPLAADPALHPRVEPGSLEPEWDVSFIGNWRPERTRLIKAVVRGCPDLRVGIFGSNWGEQAGDDADIMRVWSGKPVLGKAFADVVHKSRLNLNIHDLVNYPSANMRFFEVPCAGGALLTSPAPEMEEAFAGALMSFSREDWLGDGTGLVARVRELLDDEERRLTVARAACQRVHEEHTYGHRVRQILSLL
ncbi:MAG: glycosyltransferase [Myxococcota bacterium]